MTDSQKMTRTAFTILAMLIQRSSPSSPPRVQVALIHPSLCGWQWKWAGGQLELPPTLSGRNVLESFSIFCITSCFQFKICKKEWKLLVLSRSISLSQSSKRCNHTFCWYNQVKNCKFLSNKTPNAQGGVQKIKMEI